MVRHSRRIPVQKGLQAWWHRFASHWRTLVAGVAALLAVAGAGWQVHEYAGRFVTMADLVAHAEACNATGKDTAVWERRLTERTERLAADIQGVQQQAVKDAESAQAQMAQIHSVQLEILAHVLNRRGTR